MSLHDPTTTPAAQAKFAKWQTLLLDWESRDRAQPMIADSHAIDTVRLDMGDGVVSIIFSWPAAKPNNSNAYPSSAARSTKPIPSLVLQCYGTLGCLYDVIGSSCFMNQEAHHAALTLAVMFMGMADGPEHDMVCTHNFWFILAVERKFSVGICAYRDMGDGTQRKAHSIDFILPVAADGDGRLPAKPVKDPGCWLSDDGRPMEPFELGDEQSMKTLEKVLKAMAKWPRPGDDAVRFLESEDAGLRLRVDVFPHKVNPEKLKMANAAGEFELQEDEESEAESLVDPEIEEVDVDAEGVYTPLQRLQDDLAAEADVTEISEDEATNGQVEDAPAATLLYEAFTEPDGPVRAEADSLLNETLSILDEARSVAKDAIKSAAEAMKPATIAKPQDAKQKQRQKEERNDAKPSKDFAPARNLNATVEDATDEEEKPLAERLKAKPRKEPDYTRRSSGIKRG